MGTTRLWKRASARLSLIAALGVILTAAFFPGKASDLRAEGDASSIDFYPNGDAHLNGWKSDYYYVAGYPNYCSLGIFDGALDLHASACDGSSDWHGLSAKDIHGAILSSVVPSLTRIWSKICLDVFLTKPLVVGPHLKTGLPINADHPNEVGSDLVADAVGALHRYGPACVIVDLGTANKVILLDKEGAFSGVSIGPGFKISIDALVENTAALPEVSLLPPKSVIGRNTEDAMNSGMARLPPSMRGTS